jgi:hypothetical protein
MEFVENKWKTQKFTKANNKKLTNRKQGRTKKNGFLLRNLIGLNRALVQVRGFYIFS